MKNKRQFFILTSLFLIIGILSLNQIQEAYSTNTVIHNFVNSTSTGWGSSVWVENFTGLLGSEQISSIGLNVSSVAGAHVRVKVYDINGTTTNSTITHNLNQTNSASFLGNIYLQKFTGLTPGLNTLTLGYDAVSSTGNLRAKIYQDNGDPYPHTVTIERNFNNAGNGPEPPSGDLDAEKMTGLIPGKKITGMSYKVGVQAGFVRAKIYQDDGQIMHTPTITNNFVAGSATNWDGKIWLSKMTGFPSGATIKSVAYNVGNQAGNIRMKVYADDNGTGYPKTLLGESGSLAVGGLGINTVPITGTIPASGNLWVGFEVDNAATGLEFDNIVGTTTITSIHTYGSGPNPITGTFGSTGRDPYLQVTYNDYNITGYPKTLLGESASNLVCSGGTTCIVPLNATIPGSGNVWAALEFSDSSVRTTLEGLTTQIPTALTQLISHTYGTGPSPWGTTAINRTVSPYMATLYTDYNITGYPKTLLGESGSTAVTSGKHDISVSATVPSSGNVWAGFETDNAATNLVYNVTISNDFLSVDQSHIYGTGPSTFSPSNYTHAIWERLTSNFGGFGYPGNLLGESASVAVSSTGVQNIPIIATIPNNGKIWAGFEADTPSLGLSYSFNLPTNIATTTTHNYGTGPNPYGVPFTENFAPWLSVTFTTPGIILTPNSGHVGDTITISGTNFGHLKTVTFTFDGSSITTIPPTVTTDSSGSFSGVTFVVPVDTNGNKIVQATDSSSLSGSATFTIGSTLILTPNSGHVGDTITMSGNGYIPNHLITFTFDGVTLNTIPSSVTSDHLGQFNNTTFSIKSSIKGSHTIQSTDGTNSPNNTLTVKTSISLNPSSGKLGDTITISGNGYGNTQLITIKFNGLTQTTVPTTITTNTTGSFISATFSEPLNIIGTYLVIGTDTIGNTANQTYSVTSSYNFPPNCGIGGCVKPVNYTYFRSADFSKLTLIVHSNPIPFNIECHYQNGTFLTTSRWINESSTSVYNHTVNAPEHDIVGVGCYGSGLLLSFISPGNSTVIQAGANVFNGSFGAIIGIPAGMFIVVLIGSLANQRTGPIYLIASLIVAGILATIGFFVLDSGWWYMSLIIGALGLLVGRKIF